MEGSGSRERNCNLILGLQGSDEDAFHTHPPVLTHFVAMLGCGASESDSEAVKLCRQRIFFVKAVWDSWFSFASTHLAYFQSLHIFRYQLKNFMDKAVVISFNSISGTGADEHIKEDCPASEHSTSKSNKNEENDAANTESDFHSIGSIDVDSILSEPQLEKVTGQAQPLRDLPLPIYRNETSRYSVYSMHSSDGLANYAARTSVDYHVLDPPANNVWDYLTQFSCHDAITCVNDDPISNFYVPGMHETSFGGNEMHLGEVRERDIEEIPDLEDEFGNQVMEDNMGDENVELNDDIERCLSEANSANNGNNAYTGQSEEVRRTADGLTIFHNVKQGGIGKEEKSVQKMEKSENPEVHEVAPKANENVAESMPPISAYSSCNINEVLNEMHDAFSDIVAHGEDVSKMFGPYQPGIPLTTGFSLCNKFSALRLPSRAISALECGMLRRSARRIQKIESIGGQNETDMMMCSLSLTLEKLFIWEDKLHKGVKDEEKCSIHFDNERKNLKKLCEGGAKSSKIHASHLSLERLTVRMAIAFSVLEGVATRTHKIWDQELHPQICELIERLHQMWKNFFEVHKKQVCAIVKVQTNASTTCNNTDSSLKAIQLLDVDVTKLGKAFFDWIKSHRAFAALLKKWLMNVLPPDNGANASSSSLPEMLSICKRWSSAMGSVSEAQVLQALNNFSLLVQQLQLKMHEERNQRLKMEYLSDYHEKELKKLCVGSGIDWQEYASLIADADDDAHALSIARPIESKFSSLHTRYMGLRPIRIKLKEARLKQEEARKELEAAMPELIQEGLIPVLLALETFSLNMCNALEQVLKRSNEQSSPSPRQ